MFFLTHLQRVSVSRFQLQAPALIRLFLFFPDVRILLPVSQLIVWEAAKYLQALQQSTLLL